MDMHDGWLRRLWRGRTPLALLAIAVVLTAVAGFGLTRLHADARPDLLANTSSAAYRDQLHFAQVFGADPIVVMVQPTGNAVLLTGDHLLGMARLEGELSRKSGVKKVYGPGTLVNTLATEVTRIALDVCGAAGKDAENAARQQAAAAGKSQADQDSAGQQAFTAAVRGCAQRIAAEYPSLGVPALNNPVFFDQILLEPDGKTVRPFWTWALPDVRHAVITARMDPNASLADVHAVLDQVRRAATEPGLKDLRFTASGTPALTAALADAVWGSLAWLIPLALIVMLLVAWAALRAVLVLPLAALAAVWTGGLAGLAGLRLTPATLAVLTVVLGLSTDYFIQTANRMTEEDGTAHARAERASSGILPSTTLAAVATAAGMLAFVISPIPLLREFGLFMALGVAMAYLSMLLVGIPALLLIERRIPRLLPRAAGVARGASRLQRTAAIPWAAALALLLVAMVGWAALPNLKVETDPSRLLPAGDHALAQAEAVRQAVGVSGEIDLVVTGPDTSTAPAVGWLDAQSRTVVAQSAGDLQALTGLPQFLAAFNGGVLPDSSRTGLILQRIPTYFSGAVIDGGHDLALSVFGVTRITSVDRDRVLVDELRAVTSPPAGYRVYPAGLAVVAVDALTQLQQDQWRLTLLTLVMVVVVLGLAYRKVVPVVLAVLPTAAAGGAASGLLSLTGILSSPLTVVLGGVVIAFATEFSVLWLGRYRAELRLGASPAEAAGTTTQRMSPAILASSLALVAGFGVLSFSPVPAVREFGIWSALDLLLATAAVLILLPPLARAWLRRERAVVDLPLNSREQDLAHAT